MKSVLLAIAVLALFWTDAFAAPGFTALVARAQAAARHGDFQEAMANDASARRFAAGSSSNLCVLARSYCDLTSFTDSKPLQKELIARALDCAQQAVKDDPRNATAHASVAVCYAKECNLVDVKTELEDSRLFKEEAEKAIALNPKEDVAYYLLGRWNYGIAAGWWARAYVKIVYGGLPHASYQDAIADFKKACALAPGRILNHTGLAMAYEAVGDKTSEIAQLKIACALKPTGPDDRNALKDAQTKLAKLQP